MLYVLTILKLERFWVFKETQVRYVAKEQIPVLISGSFFIRVT